MFTGKREEKSIAGRTFDSVWGIDSFCLFAASEAAREPGNFRPRLESPLKSRARNQPADSGHLRTTTRVKSSAAGVPLIHL
jgi:hypothetical protein